METEDGQHDNLGMAYKRDLMKLIAKNFALGESEPAGKLQFVPTDGRSLILTSEWKSKLPDNLS